MIFQSRSKLAGFVALFTLCATLVGLMERRIWRQTDQLQRQFRSMQQGGFHMADHLEAAVLRLNNTLFRFDLRENPADRELFNVESEQLRSWLEENKENVESGTERELLEEIETALQTYLAHASSSIEESEKDAGPGSPAMLFERTERASDRLFGLSRKLAQAQRDSLQLALGEAHEALMDLKLLLAGSLGLLILLTLVVTFIVYRGMIAPLRGKLIETRALVERQEKLASLGALAAGVAHEIRNPLTAIKARLFTQEKVLTGEPEALEDNRFICEEISRLDDIIKDFLGFARPSEPRFETVRATSPFRELTRLLGPELEKKGIELKPEFLADPEIRIDVQQMKQVLINLIKNASESIGHSGIIILRTRTQLRRGAGRGKHAAVLEVEDTGIGIPPEVQRRLFDPFFTTKEGGTGLGLSIAARILEKHHAMLEYRTRVGQGATFSVILPLLHDHDQKFSQNSTD